MTAVGLGSRQCLVATEELLGFSSLLAEESLFSLAVTDLRFFWMLLSSQGRRCMSSDSNVLLVCALITVVQRAPRRRINCLG